MQITFEFHGVLRRQAGAAERSLKIPDGATLAAALQTLAAEQPEIAELLPRCACAEGERMLLRREVLAGVQRIALLPPVAGG